MAIIEFIELTKIYRNGKKSVLAVDGLSLAVDGGQVYGFLGPNGAGKSTTIRVMLDLIRPTSGAAVLFGEPVRKNPASLSRVGALVEGAQFYDFMTGRQNLQALAMTAGSVPEGRVNDLLTQVGLQDRADRKVGGYSTGMKQRLGLAAALLTDPEIVVLDEPTNGLDPAGIIEIRTFIRKLADEEKKTVFLSSHLLNEVEQICDRVAIINKGSLVREGTVEALIASTETSLRFELGQPDQALAMLKEAWPVEREGESGWLRMKAGPDDSPAIVRFLVENHVDVRQVVLVRQTLENYFLSVTDQEKNDD